ncbi:DUF6635 family protein [Tropicimonas sp. IMCC34043]|uniref:DUF6635 family protein n=1 Tax=Tropicimonas sp. IMCC34043 TaxID=2248760 RepID=UPI000E284A9A|nr:DUF6635 family protein [Tropicimonas sp. IMCC34043]
MAQTDPSPADPRPPLAASAADAALDEAIARYFDTRRARVDGFVTRNFTLRGTLRLHRTAAGWDILRAPVNIALSPVHVVKGMVASLCGRLGLVASARWLDQRHIMLPTRLSHRIEALVLTDLFEIPLPEGEKIDPKAVLAQTLLTSPLLGEALQTRIDPAGAEALARRMARSLGEYAGSRSAVAEMTTALCTLGVGALTFHSLTPGVISIAPNLADAVAHGTAVAEFPLGQTLGTAWYGMFPVGASAPLTAGTIVVLVMIASLAAAFAGVVADPVQHRLGIHRRRLLRLIDALQGDVEGFARKGFVAREHYYARLFDVWDAATSLTRLFRG